MGIAQLPSSRFHRRDLFSRTPLPYFWATIFRPGCNLDVWFAFWIKSLPPGTWDATQVLHRLAVGKCSLRNRDDHLTYLSNPLYLQRRPVVVWWQLEQPTNLGISFLVAGWTSRSDPGYGAIKSNKWTSRWIDFKKGSIDNEEKKLLKYVIWPLVQYVPLST